MRIFFTSPYLHLIIDDFSSFFDVLPIRLKTLSLGAHVEVASSSSSRTQSTVTDALVLTDHQLFPLMFSDIKFFSGGFLIFRSDIGTNLIMYALEEIVLKNVLLTIVTYTFSWQLFD